MRNILNWKRSFQCCEGRVWKRSFQCCAGRVMCMNWKILLGIGAVMLLAYVFAPNIASYAWVLFALACPLSMILMTAGMKHGHAETFVCSECGLAYREREWAQKCFAWCKEYHSCNLEITKHAVQ